MVVITAVLLVWGATSSLFIRNYLMDKKEKELLEAGRELGLIVDELGTLSLPLPVLRVAAGRIGGEIYLTDENGVYLSSSLRHRLPEMVLAPDILVKIRRGENATRLWEGHREQEPVIAVATPVVLEGRVAGAVVLVAPVKGVDAAINAVRSQILRATLLALVLGIGVGLGISYGMTRQIREIAKGVNRFAQEDLGYRIPVITNDELGEIADNFNRMAESIESNNKRRQALLAAISHEVRTPLTNILGYLEAVQDGVISDADLKPTLELVTEEAHFIEKMVSDILDLARMDATDYNINISKFDLIYVVNKVVKKLEAMARATKNKTVLDVPPSLMVEGDEVRMEQLLTNLYRNALQFTREGTITIALRENDGTFDLKVKDTGIGIPKEHLPYIFDPFYKADPSRAKEYKESGLGLTVVKSIVRLHGGTIHIESQEGQGTTISIRLPKLQPKVHRHQKA